MKGNGKKLLSLLLICTLMISLVACGGSSKIKTIEEAKTALTNAGWTVETGQAPEGGDMAGQEGVVGMLSATKGEGETADNISFTLFEKTDYAKKAFELITNTEMPFTLETVKEGSDMKHLKMNFLGIEMHLVWKEHAILTYGVNPDNIKDVPSLLGMD